jgi:hypothetical protein
MAGGASSFAPDPGYGALINKLANPPNPLTTLGTTVNALTAAKQFQANQAAANAYQQSVDPNTGQFDQNRFNALLSQGPGSWNMGAQMEQSGRGFQAQGLGAQADVTAKLQQLDVQQAYMAPLLQKANLASQGKGPPVTQADVQAALANMPPGIISQQRQADLNQRVAEMGPNSDYNGMVLGGAYATTAGRDMLKLQQPQYGGIATGGGYQVTQANPYAAGGTVTPPPGTTVPMTLTPENRANLSQWLAEPYNWTDQNGKPQQGTKADYYKSKNINPYTIFGNNTVPPAGTDPARLVAPQGPPPAATPGQPAAAPPAEPTGRPPPPAPGPTGTPAVTPPAPMTPGAPPVPTAALPAAIVDQGQKDYIAAQAINRTLPERLAPLHNAMGLLRVNPDLQTGPGQQQWNEAVTGAAAALNLPVTKTTSDYQELTKYLAQNIRAQGSIAGQTDLGRLETEASNPNPTTQSRAALQLLIAKSIGAERLRAAGYEYFNQQQGGAAQAAVNSGRYNIETTDWQKRQDPAAYAVDEMEPQAVRDYYNGLSGTYDAKTGTVTGAKKQFIDSLRDAKAIYRIEPNQPAAPPGTPTPTPTPTPPAAGGYTSPGGMYGGTQPSGP